MTTTSHPEEFEAALEHGYADNNGVRIHYAALGSGPLLILIHGFPDHWYSWRHQMPALATDHRVLAVDLRGYNLSDKPTGAQNYAMATLVEDIRAVIDHVDAPSATVVGHDWGGAIAWTLQNYPPPPYTESTQPWPAVQVPVLMIHGLRDTAILPGGLNGSWERVSAPLTILTLPEAGHFVQHDSAEAVTTAMVSWLHATPPRFADS